jgi:hypothetical protein
MNEYRPKLFQFIIKKRQKKLSDIEGKKSTGEGICAENKFKLTTDAREGGRE